jgi:hypothetical protein
MLLGAGPFDRGAGHQPQGAVWATFRTGDRVELDVVCSGAWVPATILKIEPVEGRPEQRDYYIRRADGSEWSFRAPGIVAPCGRAAGGIARDRAALPAPLLGVYVCNYRGQWQPVFDFALLTGSTYRNYDGARGTYRLDARTRQLVFATGPMQGARAQQEAARHFQFLNDDGHGTGNHCAHNAAKDPNGRW